MMSVAEQVIGSLSSTSRFARLPTSRLPSSEALPAAWAALRV